MTPKQFCAAIVTLTMSVSAGVFAAQPLVIDRDNIVITESVKVQPGAYQVEDADDNGVLQVRGDGIEIDFAGATLQAADPKTADLSQAKGIGISIEGSQTVTIRNAKIHGYFFNVRALRAPGLKLENCDVSFSRAHRIAVDGHPIEIWLVLRDLEAWRSYGAGIWIEGCDRSTLRKCRGSGAQNGALLVDSSDCTVTECDFSFNSGFGIGLWGAKRNLVAWNRIDFVNRPWGGGWGGDSAALVIVNDSNENYLVGNSMTHGGDGLFLTDRLNGGFSERNPVTDFKGSCDNNIIAVNDGSWSTANAFEGTFSFSNVYHRNLANDSNFGFWLGYSSDSLLLENEILRNANDGIAIEHGHGNRIEANRLADNRGAAVALWSSGPEWLDKLHPSRDVEIRDNAIHDCGRAYRLDMSTNVSVAGNNIENTRETPFEYVQRPPTGALEKFQKSPQHDRLQVILATRPKDFRLLREEPGPKGIPWLQPDAYSPRNYGGKLVAWRNRDAATLEMLPLVDGELKFSPPDWLKVTREPGTEFYVAEPKTLSGPGETRTYRIEIRGGNPPRQQEITGRFQTAEWEVRWYRWDRPVKIAYDDAAAWKKLFSSTPIHRQTTRELSTGLWMQSRPEGVPGGHFAIVATSKVRLDGGRYVLSTISDDGLRVFLDGKEVISRWNHHGPTPDEATVDIAEGVHEWVVHYCQEDGASALAFNWRKASE